MVPRCRSASERDAFGFRSNRAPHRAARALAEGGNNVEPRVEKKILGLLDVIALEVTELRGNVTELRGDVTELRGDVTELRGDVTAIRDELGAFRAETSENFNRIERRIDNHETRIEALERREV